MAGFVTTGLRGATSSSSTNFFADVLGGLALGAAFFTDLRAAFLTVFFFEAGLDALTAVRFFTVFLTAGFFAAFFFGDGVAFFVRDDFFVTAFFFLFAIPIPPLRFSPAQRPPSSMNEQPLATTPDLDFHQLAFLMFLRTQSQFDR